MNSRRGTCILFLLSLASLIFSLQACRSRQAQQQQLQQIFLGPSSRAPHLRMIYKMADGSQIPEDYAARLLAEISTREGFDAYLARRRAAKAAATGNGEMV